MVAARNLHSLNSSLTHQWSCCMVLFTVTATIQSFIKTAFFIHCSRGFQALNFLRYFSKFLANEASEELFPVHLSFQVVNSYDQSQMVVVRIGGQSLVWTLKDLLLTPRIYGHMNISNWHQTPSSCETGATISRPVRIPPSRSQDDKVLDLTELTSEGGCHCQSVVLSHIGTYCTEPVYDNAG